MTLMGGKIPSFAGGLAALALDDQARPDAFPTVAEGATPNWEPHQMFRATDLRQPWLLHPLNLTSSKWYSVSPLIKCDNSRVYLVSFFWEITYWTPGPCRSSEIVPKKYPYYFPGLSPSIFKESHVLRDASSEHLYCQLPSPGCFHFTSSFLSNCPDPTYPLF